MNTSGGNPTKVAQGAHPRVSPDGKTVMYFRVSDPKPPLFVDPGYGNLIERTIATGNERNVLTDVECCTSSPLFEWAPDSRHMVFQKVTCGCGGNAYMDLNILDTVYGKLTELQVPRAIAKNSAWNGASYRPDGTLFLFEIPNLWTEKVNSSRSPQLLACS